MEDPHREVVLESVSGEKMCVPYKVLAESAVLKKILSDPVFQECLESRICIPVASSMLQRSVEYLVYKQEYHEKEGDINDFVVHENESLNLLEVSAFLRI
ncbi:hypothetical protein NECID01_1338 [Nematocida sp. AWRm77]|nr:hypothetical protein NECID01_1338 [Nematocida sp. AWRm77]